MSVDICKRLDEEYWEGRQWERYLSGEVLYDIRDVRVANTIRSWLEEETPLLTREKIEEWLSNMRKWILLIEERKCDSINASTYDSLIEVRSILHDCIQNLLRLWTLHSLKWTSTSERKNEIVSTNEFINLSFWRICSERKNKMLFFPGIQIEVSTFLQSVEVISYDETNTDEIEHFFSTAHAGYLYAFEYMDPKKELEDDLVSLRSRKSLKVSPRARLPSLRRQSKRSTSTGSPPLVAKLRNLNMANRTPNPTRKPSETKKPPVPKKKVVKKKKKVAKVPMKTDEEIKNALLSETGNQWTQINSNINADDGTDAIPTASHVVDLRNESMIGHVYEIKSYNTFSRKKQSGNWLVHKEKELDPFELTGEIMFVSLKVPVEEVFMGPVEPTMAFQEENGGTWKNGVFTTHAQFDQNTFVMSTRLSKFGKIALFQCNDFHFPYRKWNIEFRKDNIIFLLHTSTVALSFLFEGHTIMLETQTGDEFSKLRSLHGKQLSLQEMAIQMQKHGVYIFPNELILKKNKGQIKNYDLEIYVARYLCLNRLDSHASRMNSSLSLKTIMVNLPNKTLQVIKQGENSYDLSFGQDTGGLPSTEKINNPCTLSNLFRWLLITRALSLTK